MPFTVEQSEALSQLCVDPKLLETSMTAENYTPPPCDVLVSSQAVQMITSLSSSRIWELEQIRQFPKRIKIGPARVAWSLREISAWIDAKKAARAAA